MKKVLITGTGRSGTSVLVWLLTELGLDTGFTVGECRAIKSKKNKAGLESVNLKGGPRIIKSPYLCDKIPEIHTSLEYVIVPMRDVKLAAVSRINNGKSQGGLWRATDFDSQVKYLEKVNEELFADLAKTEVPYTELNFPDFTLDPEYCYNQLSYLLSDIDYEKFLTVFNSVMDPTLSTRNK